MSKSRRNARRAREALAAPPREFHPNPIFDLVCANAGRSVGMLPKDWPDREPTRFYTREDWPTEWMHQPWPEPDPQPIEPWVPWSEREKFTHLHDHPREVTEGSVYRGGLLVDLTRAAEKADPMPSGLVERVWDALHAEQPPTYRENWDPQPEARMRGGR